MSKTIPFFCEVLVLETGCFLKACGKHNIYVILDMHGAPGGQTGQNIDDSPNNEPELFMNPIFEHRLTRLWLKLVERYKDNPVVAGYDLLNEPLPERTGAAEKYKHLLDLIQTHNCCLPI